MSARIGIDYQAAQGDRLTGLGIYTKYLVRSILEITKSDPSYNIQFSLYQHPMPLRNTLERVFWENVTAPARAKKDNVDLFHTPAFASPFLKPAKVIMTVHDLIGMLFHNQKGLASTFYWGKWLPLTASRADAVIACSESTKRDLVKKLQIPEKRITVAYPAGREEFGPHMPEEILSRVKRQNGVSNTFFLFVGTIEPRKNLERIVRVFLSLKLKKFLPAECKLVVVGAADFAGGKVYKKIVSKADYCWNSIVFPGYVSDSDLNALYCSATALIFPSLYEGFGIPVVEAMMCGCPVITSSTSSLPEVGGDAALLINPQEDSELAEAILKVYLKPELRDQMRRRGFEQAKRFSWHQTAKITMDVYKKVLDS